MPPTQLLTDEELVLSQMLVRSGARAICATRTCQHLLFPHSLSLSLFFPPGSPYAEDGCALANQQGAHVIRVCSAQVGAEDLAVAPGRVDMRKVLLGMQGPDAVVVHVVGGNAAHLAEVPKFQRVIRAAGQTPRAGFVDGQRLDHVRVPLEHAKRPLAGPGVPQPHTLVS